MAVVFKVNVDGFGDLPVSPGFGPRVEINRRPNNEVQSQTDIWTFDGLLPVEAGDLKTQRDALLTAFKQPVGKIDFTADGVSIETIGPETHVRGAFFRNFDVQITGGEWVNLLRYRFEVRGTRALLIPNVTKNDKRVTTREVDGVTTTSISVTAEGPGALQFVSAQKPGNASRSTITSDEKNDRASGTFDIDESGDSSQVSVEETVVVSPGIFPATHTRSVRSANPTTFHESRLPTLVTIRGRIEAKTTQPIVPPIPDNLSKFLSRRPRIERDVRFREGDAESTTEREGVNYAFEFEVPFEITIDEIMEGRRAIAREVYVSDTGSTSGLNVLEEEE